LIRAVIFDCFGVLITDALQALWDELNSISPDKAVEAKDIVRAANKGIIDVSESRQKIAELFGYSQAELAAKISSGEQKNLALLEYVVALKGSYKTALLSNIGKGSLSRRFSDEELTRHFDVVVASGDVGYAKPEAEVYEIVADRLGVRLDECVFTDDREEFCEAAKAVGMQAIVFTDYNSFKIELETLLANPLEK
jgi:HAD superfamily hydrolase (TIGR01509 family)